LMEESFKVQFKPGDCVFIQDMTDLFAWNVPSEYIDEVLKHVGGFPETKFLLLTKNPYRYIDHLPNIPENCILGATIETNGWGSNRRSFYQEISEAPHPLERLDALIKVREVGRPHEVMVSIEPILDFDLDFFLGKLRKISPDFVVVGYDNYNNRLPEPSLKKTLGLIAELEKFTTVYRKTLRKAWWEC